MLSAADNALLTRTGPGTALGDYFRRFWLPVALSRELPEPDGPPLRVQVLGEPLLAFRDTRGRVGLVDPRCPHRGADLYFGRNEECGLRCAYHGWKFDVEGRCVDLPNVPAHTAPHMQVALLAYPTREFGEMVWAYLGPGPAPAQVPQLEMGLLPESQRFVTKKLQMCNWAQSIEGALDTAHFSFLHMPAPGVPLDSNPHAAAEQRRLRWMRNDPQPQFHFLDHAVGFVIGASRRADGTDRDWRTTQFMLPAHGTTPSTLPGDTYFGYTWVPITDEECWIYTYAWNPSRPIPEEERAKFRASFSIISQVDEHYVPVRNRHNNYLLDRQEQKLRSFTGIQGIAEQDAMIQESQGLIVDRTREHLTATDAGVVRFRRLVLEGVKALQAGQAPAAPGLPEAYTLRSGSQLADASLGLEQVMRMRFGNPIGRASGPERALSTPALHAAAGR